MEVFVDDPHCTFRGARDRIMFNMRKLLLGWLTLGCPLAPHKTKHGTNIKWIGSLFITDVEAQEVRVEIPDENTRGLTALTKDISAHNVVSHKVLRTYVGKLQQLASLIVFFRPFVSPFWAILHHNSGNAPRNCCWASQFEHAISWIMAFLHELAGMKLMRVFRLQAHLNLRSPATIITDASPFGIGAIFLFDGTPIGHFADKVCKDDMATLGITDREKGQQCWEALCMLVALRVWRELWLTNRIALTIKGDSITALQLVNTLKARGGGLRIIACELAFELSSASFEPDTVEHIPGVCNDLADTLSRKFDPARAAQWKVPPLLATSRSCSVPPRPYQWWRTLQWIL